MDILKRSLAPITDEAWDEIIDEARDALRQTLTARRFVDVIGPKGLDYPAVGLGRLDVPEKQPEDGVRYGVHRVQPLVETRIQIQLGVWELDNAARGAKDIDLDPVSDAAKSLALFEEDAIYRGFKAGGIAGMAELAEHDAATFDGSADKFPETVIGAMLTLQNAGVEGPYTLVLNSDLYRVLERGVQGYPPRRRIEDVIGGPIVVAPHLEGGFLVSTRGGDLELTLGQDVSLGYEDHDTRTVRLYLSESFTFQIVDPAAYVPLAVTK